MTLTESFDQLDWATIASYVELQQEEHLHLDFKTVKNAELTSGDDRRNLARCISGFANSSGGIIIWGIDARKNNGIDCATAIVELRKPAVLVSRLNTLSGDATSPIIDGLRHKPIVNSRAGVAGVVATLVPETDGGPYKGVDGAELHNVSHVNNGRPVVSWDKEIGVIHANGIRVNLGTIKLKRIDQNKKIEANVTIYCE